MNVEVDLQPLPNISSFAPFLFLFRLILSQKAKIGEFIIVFTILHHYIGPPQQKQEQKAQHAHPGFSEYNPDIQKTHRFFAHAKSLLRA